MRSECEIDGGVKKSNPIIKHGRCSIELTPTERFPEMVTITRTTKTKNLLEGRRYINIDKCILQIDEFERDKILERDLKRWEKSKLRGKDVFTLSKSPQ